jgi:hypothetical protein
MTIILSFSDTASLGCGELLHDSGNFLTCHCQMNWEPVLADLFSEFPVVVNAAMQEATSFSHLFAVPVAADVACPDAPQL